MVTALDLGNILDFEPVNKPITTLYLSIDAEGKKNKQHKILFKDILKYKSQKTYFKNLTQEESQSVQNDFKKIEDYINMEFGMNGDASRSVAIFSCSEADLWESIKFSVPMDTSMVVNRHPYLRPLVEAASRHRNYALILVDRAKARIVEMRMGKAVEHFHVHEEDMPDQVKKGGFGGTTERRVERHINDHVRWHLKRVAEEAKKLQEKHDYKWVYIGGRPEIINEFEKVLHSYVKERVVGHLELEPGAPLKEVLEKVGAAEQDALVRYEKQFMRRLNNGIGQSRMGIGGILGVLHAQQHSQIDTLLIQQDFSRKGMYCPRCNYLTIHQEETCPLDGEDLRRTPDIVDNLIYNVLKQGASVEMISREMEDYGDIGAILRYPIAEQVTEDSAA